MPGLISLTSMLCRYGARNKTMASRPQLECAPKGHHVGDILVADPELSCRGTEKEG